MARVTSPLWPSVERSHDPEQIAGGQDQEVADL
jgi:hypothetical protein